VSEPAADAARAAEAYRDKGLTVVQTAALMGWPVKRTRKALAAEGVQMRQRRSMPDSPEQLAADVARAAKAYREKRLTVRQTADLMGWPLLHTRAALAAAGVQTRRGKPKSGSHKRNAQLEARIAELGYRHDELADEINAAIAEATGKPGRFDGRRIRMLVSGLIQWPRPVALDALQRVLGGTWRELGFIPNSEGIRGRRLPTRPLAPTGAASPADVDEQHWVPELTAERQLTDRDITYLYSLLDDTADADARRGGVGLAGVAEAQADHLIAALPRLAASLRAQCDLQRIAARLMAAACWYAVDAADPAAADAYLSRALRLAIPCADRFLDAYLIHVLIEQCRAAGRHDEAARYAAMGVRHGARRGVRLPAGLHLQMAHAHAYRGELPMALRSIGMAHKALGRETRTPAWLPVMDTAAVHATTAVVYQLVGQYAHAATSANDALAALPPTRVRDRTITTLDLARAHLGLRDVEQAAHHATAALELAGQLTGGLHAGRAAGRLAELAQLLAVWYEVPEAQHWLAAYQAATNRTGGYEAVGQ
jgi:tetratricopeptide (TPR) repeat protein